MTKKKDVQERLDDLREAVMYAPLGLLYEYDEVVPKLVRRGKSQVQIAKLVGKAATGRPAIEKNAAAAAGQISDFLARTLLEAGDFLGITPETEPQEPDAGAQKEPKTTLAKTNPEPTPTPKKKKTAVKAKKKSTPKKSSEASRPASLPIAGYDDLTAKEVIQLLEDLSAKQRSVIREHEVANRSRKTVLAKLDRLGA